MVNESQKRDAHREKTKGVRIGKNVEEDQLKRLPPVLRSKYSFYGEAPANIKEAQSNSQRRLQKLKRQRAMDRESDIKRFQENDTVYASSLNAINKGRKMNIKQAEELMLFERDRHERLIGQLKAAEARNRVRILKMRYVTCKEDEIEHLIECQQTALKAVRLEAFLPPVLPKKEPPAVEMSQIEKRRIEALINDSSNSLVDRKLY